MAEASARRPSDHSDEGAENHSQHVAFGSIRYIPSKNSVLERENGTLRATTAVGSQAFTGVAALQTGASTQTSAPLWSSIHTHDFVSPTAATSRPEDPEVAAAAGWDCSFCLTQRGAEDFAKAYTSLLVTTQQELCNSAVSHAQGSQQQTPSGQQQQVWQQPPQHQDQVQEGQRQSSPGESTQLQQRVEQVTGNQQHQEQNAGKGPACFAEDDWRKTMSAGTSNVTRDFRKAVCPAQHPHSDSVSVQIATSAFPPASVACARDAAGTARAYVSHLTLHREDERSPSPRRVPAGFVARKYAQNLQAREERLIHVAAAAAGECTGSLSPARAAQVQHMKTPTNISPTQPCRRTDTSQVSAGILSNANSVGRDHACTAPGTVLQPHQQQCQTQQCKEQQQCEVTSTNEADSIVSSALHRFAKPQPQMVAGWTNGSVEHAPTKVDSKHPTDGAVLSEHLAPRAVLTGGHAIDTRTPDVHFNRRKETVEEMFLPAVAIGAENAEEANVQDGAVHAQKRASGPLLQCEPCADLWVPETRSLKKNPSVTQGVTQAAQNTPINSESTGTTTNLSVTQGVTQAAQNTPINSEPTGTTTNLSVTQGVTQTAQNTSTNSEPTGTTTNRSEARGVTQAAQNTPINSEPTGTATSSVDSPPLAIRTWLDEQQRLQLE